MPSLALAFFVGILAFCFFAQFASLLMASLFMLAGLLLFFRLRKRFLPFAYLPLVAAVGFSWCLLAHHQVAKHIFPTELETKPLIAMGSIVSIPEVQKHNVAFEFLIQHIKTPVQINYPLRVRLRWYSTKNAAVPHLHVGENWQFSLRLKKPHGFRNPGSFDYELSLFEHHIQATGYVVNSSDNHFVSKSDYHWLDRLRENLATTISQVLSNTPHVGLVNALAVGIRHEITQQQWQIMRATGTNHLFAIAGLHIGFVSSMVYASVHFLWRQSKYLPLWVAAPQASALAALLSAVAYSALAGFSLPTQRAVIMTAAFLLATFFRKNLPRWHALSLALLSLLIIEPLSVYSNSFWLSFFAVFYIIYGLTGRVNQDKSVWRWSRAQWVIAVGLIPFSLLFFHSVSLLGFVANLLAIPWIGFLTLPLVLSGVLFLSTFPVLGKHVLVAAEYSLKPIWWLLIKIAACRAAQYDLYIYNFWILFSTVIATLLLLAPRGLVGRWLGFVWLLPLVFWKPSTPKTGEVWFTLLDVGQGLSAVIQTKDHILLYDTGPSFGESFDAGQAVVIPFLQSIGAKKIDAMVISHPDNDHSGGANSIIAEIPTKKVITSVTEKFQPGLADLCYSGQRWQWDQVNFQMLYPPIGQNQWDNDSSCVLRIDNGRESILLTGDIEKRSEKFLVEHARSLLASTVLVAPHHGSRTSSTLDFIEAVHPRYVLFPVGYLNKFHFPNINVLARYQNYGVNAYSTAKEGAITCKLTTNQVMKVSTYQQDIK